MPRHSERLSELVAQPFERRLALADFWRRALIGASFTLAIGVAAATILSIFFELDHLLGHWAAIVSALALIGGYGYAGLPSMQGCPLSREVLLSYRTTGVGSSAPAYSVKGDRRNARLVCWMFVATAVIVISLGIAGYLRTGGGGRPFMLIACIAIARLCGVFGVRWLYLARRENFAAAGFDADGLWWLDVIGRTRRMEWDQVESLEIRFRTTLFGVFANPVVSVRASGKVRHFRLFRLSSAKHAFEHAVPLVQYLDDNPALAMLGQES